MANYVSATSDKSRKKAIRKLLTGFLGLHLFYVGRVKAGIIRLLIGLAAWVGFIIGGLMLKDYLNVVVGIVILLLFKVPDLIKLQLGKFQDNIGQYLRE